MGPGFLVSGGAGAPLAGGGHFHYLTVTVDGRALSDPQQRVTRPGQVGTRLVDLILGGIALKVTNAPRGA